MFLCCSFFASVYKMASIRAQCLKFVFSILLVMVILKVSSITDAAPSEIISKSGSQFTEESEYANDGTTYFVAREVDPAAKKSKMAKIKEIPQKIIKTVNKGIDAYKTEYRKIRNERHERERQAKLAKTAKAKN